MGRNKFEAMDGRAARAVGRLLEEPCTWVPMKGRVQGGGVTRASMPVPDPGREVVRGIRAIVTWRPGVSDAAAGEGGASIAGGQLVVDIAREAFPTSPPIRGDLLELPEQSAGERLVEVIKGADDGSSRILFTCQVVNR